MAAYSRDSAKNKIENLKIHVLQTRISIKYSPVGLGVGRDVSRKAIKAIKILFGRT